MRRTVAKATRRVSATAVHRKTRRAKKPAAAPVVAQFQDEDVTPEEMAPIAAGAPSTEDVEDQAETTSEGDEWPG